MTGIFKSRRKIILAAADKFHPMTMLKLLLDRDHEILIMDEMIRLVSRDDEALEIFIGSV